ncbi:MAG: hypothetical protein IT320_03550 [Anaerolineae bacterium]|nr:hypothetical protein [Anaerolineae bacterium]
MKPNLRQGKVATIEPRDRFPILVTSIGKLSASLQQAVQPYCSGETHIVRIPPGYYPFRRMWGRLELPFGWRRTPERIMVFEPDAITIIESDPAGQVTTTTVLRTALLKIHVFVELLYAYIELVWVDGNAIETRKFEYNTVGEALILQGIDRLRAAYSPCLPAAQVDDREKTPARLPLKFHNYLRGSLLPDEQLLAAIFQPAIWQRTGVLRQCLSPNRAVGITERQIILVEDRKDRFSVEVNYSTVCCFYPLAHIQHMDVEVTEDASRLKLQHGCGGVMQATDIALSPANAEAVWSILQSHAPSPP